MSGIRLLIYIQPFKGFCYKITNMWLDCDCSKLELVNKMKYLAQGVKLVSD
jgi:hypothetical protein